MKCEKISEEQKAFEKWYRRHHFATADDVKSERYEHGYKNDYVDGCWRGWQAALAYRAAE